MLQQSNGASRKAEDVHWWFIYIPPTPNQQVQSQESKNPRICVCRVGEESQLGAKKQGDRMHWAFLRCSHDAIVNAAFDETTSAGLVPVNLVAGRQTKGARPSQGERAHARRLDRHRHFSCAGESAKVGAVAGGQQRCNRLSQVSTWQKNPQEARGASDMMVHHPQQLRLGKRITGVETVKAMTSLADAASVEWPGMRLVLYL
ncbi:hypothetical protein BGZ61DRAFT_484022 [Ilyonectria robusta]|uniref:uncharacterized protein n=1 Tax=Ilyonectria robusta TaxID=1079257 RepID=UPI001E8CA269|nr:uncharacterized protein BGZ61DRAFT_484022 [Ilyonectria robusta]KAH8666082.1 hypothetical protein BGZ61DRAFT_484022 [Ilyonectria robusta]